MRSVYELASVLASRIRYEEPSVAPSNMILRVFKAPPVKKPQRIGPAVAIVRMHCDVLILRNENILAQLKDLIAVIHDVLSVVEKYTQMWRNQSLFSQEYFGKILHCGLWVSKGCSGEAIRTQVGIHEIASSSTDSAHYQ